MWNTVIEEIEGDKFLRSIVVKNTQTNVRSTIPIDGVFVYTGTTPNTSLVKKLLKLDENGFIIVDPEMQTSAPGIFACGDVTKKSLRQIVTAAADGAIAAESARKFIEGAK